MHVDEINFPSRLGKQTGTSITLSGHLWVAEEPANDFVCIFVHPWGILGGSSCNTAPFARKLAKDYGMRCITFDLRGVGKSDGACTYKCQDEIHDVLGACDYATTNLHAQRIVLVGSSAGAAIAGSAIDMVPEVVGYVGIGYTFGWTSSLVFGSHFKAVLSTNKPKLFIMGDGDVFTSVSQLQQRLVGTTNSQHAIISGAGHFDLENSTRVNEVCSEVIRFVNEQLVKSK